jgi:curved DNA-binding protein CbpA
MNPYEILDLPVDATPEQIKQKYKSLAQIHHPDKGGDEATFKSIKEAYEILIDPVRRKKYDSTGSTDQERPIQQECLTQLSGMFFSLASQLNPDTEDIVLRMRVDTRKMKDDYIKNIDICKGFIGKLEKLIKKIRHKGDGENFLKAFAEKQLEIRNNELLNFQRQISICDMMLEMLENYEWGLESNLIQSFMQGGPGETPKQNPPPSENKPTHKRVDPKDI